MKTRICFLLAALLGLGMAKPLAASAQGVIPQSGTYSGLFFEDDGYWSQSSGFFTLLTSSRGYYSGMIRIGLYRYGFSGYYNSEGKAEKTILRRYQNPLTLKFNADPDYPDIIRGSITDGEWIAYLDADRSAYNGITTICPDAGQYTLVIPGSITSRTSPGGDSIGTVTVTKSGTVMLAASMADGTKFTQSTKVSLDGNWPLYSPLYGGQGSLYGWLVFNTDDSDLGGDVTWIKPETYWAYYYPRGFAITVDSFGSRYQRPPYGSKILDLTYATVEFNGADFGRGVTNRVTLDNYNRVRNTSANPLSMTFSTSTGVFTGKVMHPISFEWIPFKGIVLQKYNSGGGYFPDFGRTGEVWLQSEQP